jgi:SlyX protein
MPPRARPGPPRPLSDNTESIQRLEEKIAYLERHVTEQDKAMMEMADGIARLNRELKAMRERAASGSPGGGDEATPDERPPHY